MTPGTGMMTPKPEQRTFTVAISKWGEVSFPAWLVKPDGPMHPFKRVRIQTVLEQYPWGGVHNRCFRVLSFTLSWEEEVVPVGSTRHGRTWGCLIGAHNQVNVADALEGAGIPRSYLKAMKDHRASRTVKFREVGGQRWEADLNRLYVAAAPWRLVQLEPAPLLEGAQRHARNVTGLFKVRMIPGPIPIRSVVPGLSWNCQWIQLLKKLPTMLQKKCRSEEETRTGPSFPEGGVG